MRFNPDSDLRFLERSYASHPTRELWAALLQARNRAGITTFTSEVVSQATGGTVSQFQLTMDGFEADVESIQRPDLHHTFVADGEGHIESFSRVPYDAKMILRWGPTDESPSLYIEIPEQVQLMWMSGAYGQEEIRNTMPKAEYLYVGSSVQTLPQIYLACHDRNPKHWILT